MVLTTPKPVGGSRHEPSVLTNSPGPWAAIWPPAGGGENVTDTPPAVQRPPSSSTLQPAARVQAAGGAGTAQVAALQPFVGHGVGVGHVGEPSAQLSVRSIEAQRLFVAS